MNTALQEGRTTLCIAAASPHTEPVRVLLEAGAKLNSRSEHDGSTALHAAAKHGRQSVVEVLVSRGADVNHSDKVREPMRPFPCQSCC